MNVSNQTINYFNAKTREKEKQEVARNQAILRNINTEQHKAYRRKMAALKLTMIAMTLANIWAAAQGWGL